MFLTPALLSPQIPAVSGQGSVKPLPLPNGGSTMELAEVCSLGFRCSWRAAPCSRSTPREWGKTSGAAVQRGILLESWP